MKELIRQATRAAYDDIPEPDRSRLSATLGKPGIDQNSVGFLYSLVRQIGPRTALEVGLAHGTSASCAALAAAGSLERFDVIDVYQSWRFSNVGLANLNSALGERTETLVFHEQVSHLALPRLLESNRSYDYIFIDGDHRFDAVMLDVYYAERLLEPGGFLVLDDRVWPSVGGVISYMQANYRHIDYDLSHPRLTVCRKLGEDDRDWYDFWHFEVPRNPAIEARIRRLRDKRRGA